MKPEERREMDPAPEADSPTQEQFQEFATRLLGVPKVEYERLEVRRPRKKRAAKSAPA